jgi:hypothetical protein
MAEEMVPGAGWISDDSSFYGKHDIASIKQSVAAD